jgi:Fe-S-cluster-containing hydrogenase component 2
MSRKVYTIEDLCNGCRSCELACSFALSKEYNPRKSLIKIAKVYSEGKDIPLVNCNIQCKSDPPKCVDICPTGALIFANQMEAIKMRRDLVKARKVQPVFKVIAPWKYPFPWKPWPFEEKKIEQ